MTGIGKVMYSRGKKEKGIITAKSDRWCGGCQSYHSCYYVKWPNGHYTKPCTAAVKHLETEDAYEIE